MQFLRERLSLLLLGLLPFHAFLVTVLTKVIAGPDMQPLPWLTLWKEGLLAIILLIATYEIFIRFRRNGLSGLQRFDWIDWCTVALLLVGIFVSLVTHGKLKLIAFGFKYDFVPLVSIMFLRRVEWSEWWREMVQLVLIGVGSIIAVYGIISYALPQSFFSFLGYSDLHSLYVPSRSLAPFQQIGSIGLRRMQSTMSGPNQLGLWLLIPLAVCMIRLIQCKPKFIQLPQWLRSKEMSLCGMRGAIFIAFLLMGFALMMTFSRSAWLAFFCMMIAVGMHYIPEEHRMKMFIRCGSILCILLFTVFLVKPELLVRFASSRDHILRPLEAIDSIIQHPLGQGLGTAGPASNRWNDACVFLEPGSDPSWATPHTQLCVFVDGQQVQPTDRVCSCPNIPENWYLQIGVEMGVIGFALFLALVIFLFFSLYKRREVTVAEATLLAFGGISIAALVLHAWEDAAIAYGMAVLVGGSLQRMDG